MTEPSDPMAKAQERARPEAPKRFYKTVTVAEDGAQFTVRLDGRVIRTPAKNMLAVTSQSLAEAIAGEWSAQGDRIDAAAMPITRLVNSALDGVAPQRAAVAEDITRYAGSDLLCYRADGPQGLIDRQRLSWDPVLAWAEDRYGLRFVLAEGVMHVKQPPETLVAVRKLLDPVSNLALAALHTMTGLTGSALLALAVLDRHIDVETAWTAAHVDEDWNIDQWGEDLEAHRVRESKWRDMAAAGKVADLVGVPYV